MRHQHCLTTPLFPRQQRQQRITRGTWLTVLSHIRKRYGNSTGVFAAVRAACCPHATQQDGLKHGQQWMFERRCWQIWRQGMARALFFFWGTHGSVILALGASTLWASIWTSRRPMSAASCPCGRRTMPEGQPETGPSDPDAFRCVERLGAMMSVPRACHCYTPFGRCLLFSGFQQPPANSQELRRVSFLRPGQFGNLELWCHTITGQAWIGARRPACAGALARGFVGKLLPSSLLRSRRLSPFSREARRGSRLNHGSHMFKFGVASPCHWQRTSCVHSMRAMSTWLCIEGQPT